MWGSKHELDPFTTFELFKQEQIDNINIINLQLKFKQHWTQQHPHQKKSDEIINDGCLCERCLGKETSHTWSLQDGILYSFKEYLPKELTCNLFNYELENISFDDENDSPQPPPAHVPIAYGETPGRSRYIPLELQLYIDDKRNSYTSEEKDTNRLTIERFSFCARNVYKNGREKYLYRSRFIQYLSIHQQLIGLSKEQPLENYITLAHYILMNQTRTMPGCGFNKTAEDTSIRDRFGDRIILLKYLLRQKMDAKQTLKSNNLFNDTKQCRIILRGRAGRLGNCLFLFASAYGLSLTHSCQLYIAPDIIDDLQTSFEMNLTNLLLESQLDNFTSIKQIHNHCSYIPNKRDLTKKKNVLVTPDSFSVANDLATLTLCEHTILTAGTFGWWGAFLSDNRLGDVLTDSKSDHTPIDSNCRADDYFPSWFKFLNNTN
ncbi:unnamed protein product [Adineta steineri]|uniref:L-Fucosyltransferase n=1 Tax=Adineta steineri TaxID=433720 RepID=A0A815AS08_9BILA|nr:unnamed protein product [Adineta steineri]CAF1515331.1 unnamed protein product [Adineta steineri]